jgi:site-specific recombinase XerD
MGYVLSAATAELLEEFLESEKPKVSTQGYTTLSGIARRVLTWFDDEELDVTEIGITDAVRFASSLSERCTREGSPIGVGTMRNYLKVARRCFDYLVQTGKLGSNPFRELRYPRMNDHLSRNVLSEAQMGRLLRELARFDELSDHREALRRYRVHVLAEFLYATGLRIAEACALKEANIDLEHRLVYIPQGKGGAPRTVFLTPYAADVMRLYLESGRAQVLGAYARQNAGTLFGAVKDRVAAVVNAELREVCTALELPEITSHGFRHSLGTHLLRSGCDMRHIQAILGHEALQTTQIYTLVDKEDLKKSLDEHHPRHWAKGSPVQASV